MKRIFHHQPYRLQGKWQALLIAAIVVAGCLGVWYSWTQYHVDAAEWTDTQARDIANDVWSKEREGRDEAQLPDGTLARYTVAPAAPRALYVDTLSVAARVLPMSVNTDGSLQAPYHIDDTGWYTGSARPGERGAVFIDGHASGATRKGIFAYLDTLKPGDKVRLEKGDGSLLAYEVVHAESIPLDTLDMRTVLQPYGDTTHGLNLMTCTGKWLADRQTYDHRVVVYARQL